MARTVEQIERDIVALEQAIATFAQEFEGFYRQYLDELSQSVRRQLVLASYYVCTQSYPEQFLALSVSQRENLQRSLRQLAKTAQSKLLGYLEPLVEPEPGTKLPDASPQPPAAPNANGLRLDDELSLDEDQLDDDQIDDEQLIAAIDFTNLSLSDFGDLVSRPQGYHPEAANPDLDPELGANLRQWFSTNIPARVDSIRSNPGHLGELEKLARWQTRIELGINETLRELSQAANHLLYQATILPNHLPEPLLEVATKSGMAAESASGSPNVLKLRIEAKSEHEVSVTEIMVVRLRLLDIEEADYGLRAWPSKVRDISQRLNQMGREYQRKCKERAIAQSEQAWRAIWFED